MCLPTRWRKNADSKGNFRQRLGRAISAATRKRRGKTGDAHNTPNAVILKTIDHETPSSNGSNSVNGYSNGEPLPNAHGKAASLLTPPSPPAAAQDNTANSTDDNTSGPAIQNHAAPSTNGTTLSTLEHENLATIEDSRPWPSRSQGHDGSLGEGHLSTHVPQNNFISSVERGAFPLLADDKATSSAERAASLPLDQGNSPGSVDVAPPAQVDAPSSVYAAASATPDHKNPSGSAQSADLLSSAHDHTTSSLETEASPPPANNQANGTIDESSSPRPDDNDATTSIAPPVQDPYLAEVGGEDDDNTEDQKSKEAEIGRIEEERAQDRDQASEDQASEDGESEDGESEDGESENVESEDGESEVGESEDGESEDQSLEEGESISDETVDNEPEDEDKELALELGLEDEDVAIAEGYNVEQEKPLESRFFRNDFQAALKRSKALASQLEKTLSSSRLHEDASTTINVLYTQAQELVAYQGPKHWKVGLVGDSGVGKSSLINSLLHKRLFARASGGGEACTCTATEYHYYQPPVGSPACYIEIVYFPKDELLNQFKRLLKKYRDFHEPTPDDSTGSRDEQERETLKKDAANAWHTFQAAFQNQPSLTDAYLVKQDPETLHDKFSTWIDQSSPETFRLGSSGSNLHREDFANETACSERLAQLTSESSDKAVASSWPYIERLNVYVQSKILSTGLVLVDLPGLRDTNLARSSITERYIDKCHEVFAVTTFGRAANNPSVQAVVDLAKAIRRKPVGIVCTMCDNVETDEAEGDLDGIDSKKIKELNRFVRRCEAAIATINNKKGSAQGNARLALLDKKEALIEEKESYEYQRKEHIIVTRNANVTAKLKTKYQSTVGVVYCVGNHLYRDHRDVPGETPRKWLDLSGIIALRRHCLGLMAERQLEDATAFMKDDLPNLVTDISLWVQASSGKITEKTRKQVHEACQEVEILLQDEVKGALSMSHNILHTLDRKFDQHIRNKFTTNDNSWRSTAFNAAYGWEGWHPRTYDAFCKNWGSHSTDAVGWHCWNEEIIAGMERSLRRPWQDFRYTVKDFFRRRDRVLEESFEVALAPLEGLDWHSVNRDDFESISDLLESLVHRKNRIKSKSREFVKAYESELDRLGNTYLLSPTRMSFIGEYMAPAYQEVSHDCGTGVWARQKFAIRRAVYSSRIFYHIQDMLDEEFERITSEVESNIREVSKAHFKGIRRAIDLFQDQHKEAAKEGDRDLAFMEKTKKATSHAKSELQEIQAIVREVVPDSETA